MKVYYNNITAVKNAVRFNADIEEALDYIPSNICFKNRSGARIGKQFCYVAMNKAYDECLRNDRRTRSHNGHHVPLKYVSKPKEREIVRDTIRRAVPDAEAMEAEYARSYYEAAGMC